jgi:hypothetical protein
MTLESFIVLAKTGNLHLPEREVMLLECEKKLHEYEVLRGQCQDYIDWMVKVRLRICRLALERLITATEFQSVMDRLDEIEDTFRSTDLTNTSLCKAKYQTQLTVDMLNMTIDRSD